MINGSCHCGAVQFTYPKSPEWLTACNCSICRRFASLWAYGTKADIVLEAESGATHAYIHGDRTLELHSCNTCGCTTHWSAIDSDRMAVNFRLCEPDDFENIRTRVFDGADTWEYLD